MKSRNISKVALVAVAGATVALTGCQNNGSAAQGAESGGSAAQTGHPKEHGSAGEPRDAGGAAHKTSAGETAAQAGSNTGTGANHAQQASLVSATKGQKRSAVVQVPSGAKEAASWDAKGNIWFWSNSGGTWHKIGSSRYPMLPGSDGHTTKVASSLLPGMTHAVYIADGAFTGDSTGNTIAFAATTDGKWGTVAPKDGDDALVPTGKPATDNTTPGIWRDARFASGKIETTVGNPFMANANASAYPLITDWSWKSGKFVNSSSNVFVTKGGTAPARGTKPSTCPTKLTDGNYAVGLDGSMPTSGKAPYSSVNMAISSRQSGKALCTVTVDKNLPVTAYVRSTSGSDWATVPSWMLATTLQPGAQSPVKVYDDQVGVGTSPILAPGMTAINADLGRKAVPATVTVQDGKITGIGLTRGS